MEEHERHAVLMLDEIQLSSGLAFDQTTGTIFGRPTLPLADGSLPHAAVATHGLVFMLGGVTQRWKQTVAYHLTGNSFSSTAVRENLIAIIQECEKIGVRIDAVVSDMGGGNMALWREFGIVAGKYSVPRVSCSHPVDQNRKLYFMADSAHLLKNLRNHLTRGQSIFLPAKVVKKYQLPSSEVNLEPIQKLVEIDSKLQLNIAPHLKPSFLDPGHYEKMKVGPAYSLLNHDTAAALRFLVQRGDLPREALTTAWFIETIYRWFKVLTSRTTKLAISKLSDQRYEDTLSFLKDMVSLFQDLKIGSTSKQVWKPVQTGIILVCKVALELQDYYLNEKGFFFVLLSRFGQDALENLFSTLRAKNAVPKALQFRSAIKAATLAQFFRPSRSGSYAVDDAPSLVGIENCHAEAPNHNDAESVEFPNDLLDISVTEHESFIYLAGFVVKSVAKHTGICEQCKTAMVSDDASALARLKSYTDNCKLVSPTPAVIRLLETAENMFRVNGNKLLSNEVTVAQLVAATNDSELAVSCFPSCHNMQERLLRAFFKTRIHIFLRKENLLREAEEAKSAKAGSRSIGKQAATTNVK